MQPSPIAETSRSLFPSLRFCIFGLLCFELKIGTLLYHVLLFCRALDLARPVANLLGSEHSNLNRGTMLRKSDLSNVAFLLIVPVRKPLPETSRLLLPSLRFCIAFTALGVFRSLVHLVDVIPEPFPLSEPLHTP